MKKIFIFLSCFMVIPVFAAFINENTQLQWNSKVIEEALNNTGFSSSINTYHEVVATRNRILRDLLERKTFSVIDAIKVCKEKCNMSDFLRLGRGQSGKKCPELCENFANNIIKVNNDFDTNIPGVSGATSDEFSDLQGKAVDVCRKLMSDATKNGISYPVLCGGACAYFGQDKVQITDLSKTKEYEVNDFCDNDESGREYFYILSNAKDAKDVSQLSESQRIKTLKEIQTSPVTDYIKEKKRREEEQAKKVKEKEFKTKYSSDISKYSADVNEIGECLTGNLIAVDSPGGRHFKSFNCTKFVQDLALKCRCKAKGFKHVSELQRHLKGSQYKYSCFVGKDNEWFSYVPNFEDCLARYGEKLCKDNLQYSEYYSLMEASQKCQKDFREYYYYNFQHEE